MDSIVIVSGGLDSTTLLHYVVKSLGHKDTLALAFNYGQKHTRELDCARHQAELVGVPFNVIDIRPLAEQMFQHSALTDSSLRIPGIKEVMGDPQPITYVPNRNLIFLEIATAIAESNGSDKVFYGAQLHDIYGYWDTTAEFVNRVNSVHQLNRKNHVQILAPFVAMSKADEVRLGTDLGVDYSHTWSCYEGDRAACGKCSTCAERIKAFKMNEIKDPIPYMVEIDWWGS